MSALPLTASLSPPSERSDEKGARPTGPLDPEAVSDALKALAHATRVRALLELQGAELSPTEISRRLADPKVSLATLAYHVRGLADAALIELTGATPRRGAMEHHYSLTPLGEAAVAALHLVAASIEQLDASRGSDSAARTINLSAWSATRSKDPPAGD
jgi:DNA-binding transcriptional ArsR family regulator